MKLTHQEKFALIESMRRYGSNFINKFADTLVAADPENTQRLLDAFPDLVEKYLKTN
ncbi:MAG: hypothetical protein ACO24H_03505 [Polynucleobacter sp.]